MGAQLNLKPKYEKDKTIIDFDDLWVKSPENFNTTPNVYIRHEHENDIDVLWSGLKDHHSLPAPPIVYLGIGFIAGILITILAYTILFWGTNNKTPIYGDMTSVDKTVVEQTQQGTKIPGNKSKLPAKIKQEYNNILNYTIKSGDSLGSIANKYYHSSSPKYVHLIQQANNLNSPHSITAGDKLIIPVKE